jgi:hypothetical protein
VPRLLFLVMRRLSYRPVPWVHQVAPASTDHLYNFLTAAGAVAAVAALVGGVVVAIYYRHKATLGIEGKVVTTDSGSILVARPTVAAIGPFKLKFRDKEGAVVTLTEVVVEADGGVKTDDANARPKDAFPKDKKRKAQFVSPGESLSSGCLFRVDPSTPRLLGWWVSLNIASKGWLRHGLHWADRVFVPVASSPTTGGADDRREVESK